MKDDLIEGLLLFGCFGLIAAIVVLVVVPAFHGGSR